MFMITIYHHLRDLHDGRYGTDTNTGTLGTLEGLSATGR